MNNQVVRARERVPTGRRGRPSKSMIAAALERPFCAYLHKICLNNRLEGHKYCIDHIMNDKTAPYRQCTFIHSVTGRRCTRAAHKVDRRASPLCHYHRALKLNSQLPSNVPLDSPSSLDPKSLLEDLNHHAKDSGNPSLSKRQSSNTFWVPKQDGTGNAVPSAKLCRILARYQAQRQIEEVAPIELPTMEEIAARHNNADSDTESVDNNLDMFKHASVFTEEELSRTLRDKTIKLRRLYIEQYGHIQYILKEKRLKYIQAQRMEDELYGEAYSFRNFRDSPDYASLRAMLRYHKTFGPESLLQEQAKRRKMSRPPTVGPHAHPHAHTTNNAAQTATTSTTTPTMTTTTVTGATSTTTAKTDTTTITSNTTSSAASTTDTTTTATTTVLDTGPISSSNKAANPVTTTTTTVAGTVVVAQKPQQLQQQQLLLQQSESICIFSRTPQGCSKPCIPLSPYCKQHILYDKKQVLFRPCAGGMPPCLAPVVSYTRKNKCWLHTAIN